MKSSLKIFEKISFSKLFIIEVVKARLFSKVKIGSFSLKLPLFNLSLKSFFNACTGHQISFLHKNRSIISPFVLLVFVLGKKITMSSFPKSTYFQIKVVKGSQLLLLLGSSSPILALEKKAIHAAVQTTCFEISLQLSCEIQWPKISKESIVIDFLEKLVKLLGHEFSAPVRSIDDKLSLEKQTKSLLVRVCAILRP